MRIEERRGDEGMDAPDKNTQERENGEGERCVNDTRNCNGSVFPSKALSLSLSKHIFPLSTRLHTRCARIAVPCHHRHHWRRRLVHLPHFLGRTERDRAAVIIDSRTGKPRRGNCDDVDAWRPWLAGKSMAARRTRTTCSIELL